MRFNLMHGDCLEMMQLIPDGSVDMVLADPPYGTTACKWDTVIPLEAMWAHLKRIVKPNGAIVMTAAQPFTSALVMSNPKMFKYGLVWDKGRGNAPGVAKIRPLPGHEDILVFASGKTTYTPQMRPGEPYSNSTGQRKTNEHKLGFKAVKTKSSGGRYPYSVLAVSHSPVTTVHPTQKPVALMEYLIRTYTNKNETVLDFTMGSGTTGVACVNTGRKFIGIELDQEYFDIAKERIYGAISQEQEL
jgi:16S rRNA G966 N2-methylase RsmD